MRTTSDKSALCATESVVVQINTPAQMFAFCGGGAELFETANWPNIRHERGWLALSKSLL